MEDYSCGPSPLTATWTLSIYHPSLSLLSVLRGSLSNFRPVGSGSKNQIAWFFVRWKAFMPKWQNHNLFGSWLQVFSARAKNNFDRILLARDRKSRRLFTFFKRSVQSKDKLYSHNFYIARKIYLSFMSCRSVKQFEVNLLAFYDITHPHVRRLKGQPENCSFCGPLFSAGG